MYRHVFRLFITLIYQVSAHGNNLMAQVWMVCLLLIHCIKYFIVD